MHHQLVELLVLLFSAIVLVPLFKKFNLGAILAYLFAGLVIGPNLLGLIEDPQSILRFSELGVVFLLFLIGLELKPTLLWNMRKKVFGLGLTQMLITGAAFTGIGSYLGYSWQVSFIAGFGLALSSTAFCLQILEEKRQLKTLHGQSSFSILLFQDLAVVPLITIIPVLAGTSTSTNWINIAKATGIVVAFILFGLYFVRHLFSYILKSRVQEVFTALSLFIVVGSALLMEEAGLSMGTGAFLAGVLLANSEYRHELEINLQPFKGLLLGLFFIAVGMSLDLRVLVSQPDRVFLLVLTFVALKVLILFCLARLFKLPYESSRNVAFTLPQGGEFAFVIFSLAVANQLLTPEQAAILNAAVTISMALTPLLFSLNQRYLRTFQEVSEKPFDTEQVHDTTVIIAGFGRFGQIVSRFLQSQKISFTILEHSAAQVDIARKFGRKIFYGDASRADIVASAGGKSAKIFVLAIDDIETSVKTAKMIRDKFPHLEIIARARNRQHAIDLLALGIENIHRETYLTSLEVAKEVLLSLGGIRSQINKKLALFRTHDEEILRKQFELRNNEPEMLSMTHKYNAELDKILQADQEGDKGETPPSTTDKPSNPQI